MTAPLRAERVGVRHPRAERDAVRDVTLEVREAEILALVGPNGSGKSTLLSCLAGGLRPRERARRVACLPQEPRAPEGLTVESLVQMGRHAHRGAHSGLSRRDRRAVHDALRAVDADDLRQRTLDRLSGGERRRAWIALVLAQQTPLLLLDEPTGALDLRHAAEVREHLRRINRERGTTLVVAMHELDQAAAVADRIAVLANGRLYGLGPPEKILTPETLRDVFGVDAQVSRSEGWHVRVRGPAHPIRRM